MAESEATFERAFIATQVCVEVDHAMAVGLCPTISITITGQSVARLPDLVGWLLEAGLPSGVSFYRERAGGPQHVHTVVSHPSNIAP